MVTGEQLGVWLSAIFQGSGVRFLILGIGAALILRNEIFSFFRGRADESIDTLSDLIDSLRVATCGYEPKIREGVAKHLDGIESLLEGGDA